MNSGHVNYITYTTTILYTYVLVFYTYISIYVRVYMTSVEFAS